MVAYATPASLDFHARRKHFIRLAGTIAMHEHRDVIVVLVHAYGSHPIALSRSIATRQKRTTVESVSHVEI